jgi:hypothetical protein
MKKFKKYLFRFTVTFVLLITLLISIVLNPSLLYAHKTSMHNLTIYHNKTLEPHLLKQLQVAYTIVKSSELFDASFKLSICLNDGSCYPAVIKAVKGQAFASGFYNKVVVQSNINSSANTAEFNGYKWNLIQLFAHEMIHCFQYNKLGFWHAKPIAAIANWKWEGYAEYIARQLNDVPQFKIAVLQFKNSNTASWAISLPDGTIVPRDYYKSFLLVQYCIMVKKQTFMQLLHNDITEHEVENQMTEWSNK